MKSTYIFWYRTKDGKEYLYAKQTCKKPSRTNNQKALDKLLSFDADVDACGWTIATDEYMVRFRLPHLIPHASRKTQLS